LIRLVKERLILRILGLFLPEIVGQFVVKLTVGRLQALSLLNSSLFERNLDKFA
jgi:hypothetical protein